MAEKKQIEIPKAYDPSVVEDKWYKYWQDNKVFHSEIDESKEPYVIPIPPPNVTGMLTMGHILNNTLQDIFIRTKRMQGYNTCWVPGTDHASIATETKVTNFLSEQGINKYEIGREEFLKHCWEWTKEYGGIINQQLKKLGISCDWDRERFTMDDDYYHEVIKAFVNLYKEEKIYRGYRMVNWCPASKSAISDEEVLYKNVNGKLWYFKYPVVGTDKHVVVATTRPETMFGDTGVAVNPNDERYKDVIGKKVLLPIAEREIPIFVDEYVDMEFGTGAVKVTPAHDINDNEMGQRHNLEVINILNDDASTNDNVPKDFRGLDRFDARQKVIARFEELDLIDKIEDHQHKVGYSERGGVPIEPYLSEQWFMKMSSDSEDPAGLSENGLVNPAIDVVKHGKINFYPDHWKKTYFHWMKNIRDWCISRQLWWGHRIPVWYHKETGEIYCDAEPPKDIANWKQDEDVLDTWASSWLWAHAIFRTEEERKYYYPASTLVTAPDIIFFWVARMIMAGMHFRKKIPFHDVYFTSIIRDASGRKMSKSLGNSPDPLDVIKEYSADALRFTVIYLAPLGQDVLFSVDKCEIGRNFANKIWNAGRFLLLNAQHIPVNNKLLEKHIDFADEWITSHFHLTLVLLNTAMDTFEVNNATKILYSFVWNDFCDWYLEMIKTRLYLPAGKQGSDDDEVKSATLTRALNLFAEMLKLVHPFMPFITEELWQLVEERKDGESQKTPDSPSISTSEYPKLNSELINPSAESEMEIVQGIVYSRRNIRGEMNIPPSKSIDAYIKSSEVKKHQIDYIKKLAKVENIITGKDVKKPGASASAVFSKSEIYIPLEGLIDLDVERQRIEKEINRLEGSLKGIEKKLSNEKFVNNAPADVVEKEKTKQRDWTGNLDKLIELLSNLN
jgi:valyl-tRNA synthetase